MPGRNNVTFGDAEDKMAAHPCRRSDFTGIVTSPLTLMTAAEAKQGVDWAALRVGCLSSEEF
ncbi:hypothetical protein [Thermacetogenium phaeum]|nr:hypothetical protein [Thermacetogenium phaeum]